MNNTQSLTFLTTPLTIGFAIVVGIAAAIICWNSWQRSGRTRGMGLLELTRFILVVLVVITLNQPEWLEQYLPKEEPTLVVLWDDSGSMQTRDVIDEEKPADPPKTRREWLEPLIKEEVWKSLSEKVNVVFEPFSKVATEGEAEAAEGTDINGALRATVEKHKNLRGVVLFSDGDWNLGNSPNAAATRMGQEDVPVFTVGIGSRERLPDIQIVSMDAPTFGVSGKPTRIPFSIRSSLPRDYNVNLILKSSDGKELTKQVSIPAKGTLDDAMTWTPENTGEYTLTLAVPPNDDELLKDNNEREAPIVIRKEALKVLLVESFPRWEYRYFRNALERDPGVEVSCVLFHPGVGKMGGGRGYLKEFPETIEKLGEYDVVFLGDVGVGNGQLTAEHCRLIKGLIKSQASGLILMPGLRGNHFSFVGTDLEELYPVALDQGQPRGWGSRVPSHFELTSTGRRSLLTKLADSEDSSAAVWDSLPGFQWYAPVMRAKAGSEVLAVHKTESNKFGRVPLLVTKTYGTGKILFMGTDGAWRWRKGVEDKYHYRFWGQVARWMAYQRNMAEGKSMRLFYSPDRPRGGGVVTLNANVMSAGGEPLQKGNVVVEITAPSGKTETVRLTPRGEEWGLFSGKFTPSEHGEYKLKMTCRETGAVLETKLSVQGVVREKLGQPAQYDVLEDIASQSGGETVKTSEIDQLIDKIVALPPPKPLERRFRIWCHPLWATFIVVLLGVFWTGRKMVGVI